MVQCNRHRLIYCYAGRYNLSPMELNLAELMDCLNAISKRQYRRAYNIDARFSVFVFNVVSKCAIQIAQRRHNFN